jgi:hypothetical protein
LSQKILKLGKLPSPAEANKIVEQQNCLIRRITRLNEEGKQYISIAEDDENEESSKSDSNPNSDFGSEFDLYSENEDDSDSSANISADDDNTQNLSPEKLKLLLPSSLGPVYSKSPNFTLLVKQELQLRIGEAKDALHELQVNLGHKAFLYWISVQNANSQKKKLREFSSTALAKATVKAQFHIYCGARKAMVCLHALAEILSK